MPGLQVDSRRDIPRGLGDAEVDRKLRRLNSPAVKGQSPRRHDAHCISDRGRHRDAWQSLHPSRFLQDFRTEQDRAPPGPFQCERRRSEQSPLICWSVAHQSKQRRIRSFESHVEHQRKTPDLGHSLGCNQVKICIAVVLVLDDAPHVSDLSARHETQRQGRPPASPFLQKIEFAMKHIETAVPQVAQTGTAATLMKISRVPDSRRLNAPIVIETWWNPPKTCPASR